MSVKIIKTTLELSNGVKLQLEEGDACKDCYSHNECTYMNHICQMCQANIDDSLVFKEVNSSTTT